MIKEFDELTTRLSKIPLNEEKISVYQRKKSIRLLLIETFRRSMIWQKVLKEKAEFSYFAHIIDDVANSINNDWTFDFRKDNLLLEKMPRRYTTLDEVVINYYINWEIHKEAIYEDYFLPNPYEPLIFLMEIGSGYVVDLQNRIEVRTLIKFQYNDLKSEINLYEQQVILNHDWLEMVDGIKPIGGI